MRRLLFPVAVAVAALAAAAVSASAQTAIRPGSPVNPLSSDIQFSKNRYLQIEGRSEGAPSAYVVIVESPNLPPSFEVSSLRAVGRWEICDGFQFTGECRVIEGRYQRRQATGLRRIWSARPV
jgi:hypothetical protein